MKHSQFIQKILSPLLYWFYRISGIVNKKVLIKSVRSTITCEGKELPVREFTALSKNGEVMGIGKVRLGLYQEHPYQYCIFNGTAVKNMYRRRHLAQKLTTARLNFCLKEGFENVLVPVESINIASLNMLKKCGFQFMDKSEWTDWMQAEAEYLNNSKLLIGIYRIKDSVI